MEFINDQLWRYCTAQQIVFTRGRVARKNDNPFVEQKNGSVTRLIGYDRYETARQVAQLNRLYTVYGLYVNHFLPIMKLVSKQRTGSRVQRVFDESRLTSACWMPQSLRACKPPGCAPPTNDSTA